MCTLMVAHRTTRPEVPYERPLLARAAEKEDVACHAHVCSCISSTYLNGAYRSASGSVTTLLVCDEDGDGVAGGLSPVPLAHPGHQLKQ